MAKQIRTLEERIRIIEEVEKNPFEKRVDIARRLNLPPSTLNSIVSKKDEIRKQAGKYGVSAKKRKTGKESSYSDLETVLYAWYQQARASHIPIDGSILREKALQIAASKGIESFTASNGWITRFKERHGLKFKKICGQSEAVDMDVTKEWFEKLPQMLEGYAPRDIYNADETGLFYKCLPDRTLAFKGENCHGGKSAKERLTVLLCTNSDGSDKRTPIVIGKFARPRCFKNVKKVPVTYHANSSAWMTNQIFCSFLRDLDKTVGTQSRKIILFIDNCSAHSPDLPSLNNVKVVFYPPNCTSVVQPLDLGIIKCFKQCYRKRLVQKALSLMEEGKENIKIDILQAIHFIVSSWQLVTVETIRNCFNKCGYIQLDATTAEGYDTKEEEVEDEDLIRLGASPNEVSFDKYVSIDQELPTCGVLAVEEMCAEVKETEDDNVDEAEPEPVPNFAQALKAFETMRTFIYSHEISEHDQKNVANIENLLFTLKRKHGVQTKISDYFK